MPNKNFYMKSSAGITIIKSCGNIGMTLIAEVSKFDNTDIALSLLEDVKKDLVAYCGDRDTNTYLINSKPSQLMLNIPNSLLNILAARAENEKCSLDTLCAYIFSTFLSSGLKQNSK